MQYVTARLLTLYNNILSDYYIYHRPKFLLSVHNTYNTYKVTLIKSGYMGVWGVCDLVHGHIQLSVGQ